MIAFKKDNIEPWAYFLDVLTPEQCDTIISIGKQKTLSKAVVNRGEFVVDTEYRDSNICWLDINDVGWLYNILAPAAMDANERFFNFDLYGFTEDFQFTEYVAPSGNYNYHIDRIYQGSPRKLSMVIQLTDESEYVGGDLEILMGTEPTKMVKTRGSVAFFPSYTLHRVTPVTEGTRYSLVTWFGGPPFK